MKILYTGMAEQIKSESRLRRNSTFGCASVPSDAACHVQPEAARAVDSLCKENWVCNLLELSMLKMEDLNEAGIDRDRASGPPQVPQRRSQERT